MGKQKKSSSSGTGSSSNGSTGSSSSSDGGKLEEGSIIPALLTEDDVKCPICLCVLVQPVRMPCSHCLCKACFSDNIKHTALQCPVCRMRIGTFARRSQNSGTLVDEKLWSRIKKQFKEQLELQKLNTKQRRRQQQQGSAELAEFSPTRSAAAAPGEIRKEFEQQLQQLRQAHQQLCDREDQETEDLQLARELQAELYSSNSFTASNDDLCQDTSVVDIHPELPAQQAHHSNALETNPMAVSADPQCGTSKAAEDSREQGEVNPDIVDGMPPSVDNIEGEETDDSEQDDEEEGTDVGKSSSRRLFHDISSEYESDNEGNMRRTRSRKRKKFGGGSSNSSKENKKPRKQKSLSIVTTQQFPGCSKSKMKVNISGATELLESFIESDAEEEIIFKNRASVSIKNTSADATKKTFLAENSTKSNKVFSDDSKNSINGNKIFSNNSKRSSDCTKISSLGNNPIRSKNVIGTSDNAAKAKKILTSESIKFTSNLVTDSLSVKKLNKKKKSSSNSKNKDDESLTCGSQTNNDRISEASCSTALNKRQVGRLPSTTDIYLNKNATGSERIVSDFVIDMDSSNKSDESPSGTASTDTSSSGVYSSGYGSLSSACSPTDCSLPRSTAVRKRKQCVISDDLQQVSIALMLDQSTDEQSVAAVVAEQRALEALLKQEFQDQKLAIKLQRQFNKNWVDRTKGSGEEYSLRSRGRRRRYTTPALVSVTAKRDSSSPSY